MMSKPLICDDECLFSLKRIDPTDVHELEKVIHDVFPHMKKYSKVWLKHLYMQPENTFLLKDRAQKSVGILSVQHRDNKNWINLIGVNEDHQKKGLGSSMLKIAEDISKDMNISEIHLHAEANKLENLQFYTNREWKIENVNSEGYTHSASVEFSKKL